MAKTVLITGGARSLGASITKLFASNRYNVIINYNNSYDLASLLKKDLENKYDIKILLIKADISIENDVKKMFEIIKKEFVTIDCLVNNAGISLDNDLTNKDALEFKKVLDVNLVGTYLVTKYSLDVLKKGSIINISSTNAYETGYIEGIDYDASKAGIISLTHDFAKYLAPNIRVNAVAPGWINTDMNKNLYSNFKDAEINKILLKRFAEVEEVAKVVFFLANEGTYINDTVIRVDGGRNV